MVRKDQKTPNKGEVGEVPNAPQHPHEYFRYCPGEEKITLSDAVCLGRRRSNYPKCKGCQFNDDEHAVDSPSAEQGSGRHTKRKDIVGRDTIGQLFKPNDVRAIYPDPLNPDAAWRIGQAAAQFLRSQLRGYDRTRLETSTVVVGRDARKSSPPLTEALIEGLRVGGAPVIDIGMVDTPQLYFAVHRLPCCGGIQVTGSHNPPTYNGFKICGQKAKPISVDTGLSQICKIAQNTQRHPTRSLAGLEQVDLADDYKTFVLGFLDNEGALVSADRPLKVVVDASNGMAGRWFPLIFGDIEWLDIVPLNFEHNGEFVHDPNPLAEANLSQLRDRVLRSKADLGICFDGDADRCILVDHKSVLIRGDILTALLAPYFLKESPGATIVHDIRSSRVVAEEVRKAGGMPRRERSGHAFLKKTLASSKAVFGGELSGHYYFRENEFCDSGMIAFAEVINVLNRTGKRLSELVAPLRRYANSGERSFRCGDPKKTIKRLADRYSDADIDFLDGITAQYEDWWFNVRPGTTEPLLRLSLEATDAAMLDAKLAEVCPLLGKPME